MILWRIDSMKQRGLWDVELRNSSTAMILISNHKKPLIDGRM